MKRFLGSIAIAFFVPLVAWVGGFDFSQRGPTAAIILAWSIMLFVIAYTCPYWPES